MDYIEIFEKEMKDWGYYYPKFAGCEVLEVCEDNQIKGRCIYPSSGDWVVNDIRGKSGTYGVSHDESYICSLKLTKPENYHIDITQEPLTLQVNAETLLYRYQWIGWLFSDWNHGVSTPYGLWDSTEEIHETFELEKDSLSKDPHLALYWLLHFGLTVDEKYKDIREIVLKYKLKDKLSFLEIAMLYFDNILMNGESAQITGRGKINFDSQTIAMLMHIHFLENLTNILNKIPIAGYIIFGDDGTMAVTLNISGYLENPKIATETVKDVAKVPLNILERTLTLPFKLFE